jgi:hypothetical protein
MAHPVKNRLERSILAWNWICFEEVNNIATVCFLNDCESKKLSAVTNTEKVDRSRECYNLNCRDFQVIELEYTYVF